MHDALGSAIAAARLAGAVLLEHLHRPLHIRQKSQRADLVTIADRESERVIVEHLRAAFPNAAILGEEGGEYVPRQARDDEGKARDEQCGTRHGELVEPWRGANERWIIDPLDGTTNYAHGYPLFCISIAYERDGEITAGVVYAPLMNELFTAERGKGARRNGEAIRVSNIDRVADAMVVTGFKPYDYDTNAPYFAKASYHAQAVRRDGAAALDLAYTAMGRFDAFWEFGLAPWDTAAGMLLVQEAGGRVTTIDGGPFAVDAPSILAGNGRVHDEMMAMLLR